MSSPLASHKHGIHVGPHKNKRNLRTCASIFSILTWHHKTSVELLHLSQQWHLDTRHVYLLLLVWWLWEYWNLWWLLLESCNLKDEKNYQYYHMKPCISTYILQLILHGSVSFNPINLLMIENVAPCGQIKLLLMMIDSSGIDQYFSQKLKIAMCLF